MLRFDGGGQRQRESCSSPATRNNTLPQDCAKRIIHVSADWVVAESTAEATPAGGFALPVTPGLPRLVGGAALRANGRRRLNLQVLRTAHPRQITSRTSPMPRNRSTVVNTILPFVLSMLARATVQKASWVCPRSWEPRSTSLLDLWAT